jgi:peroxisomal 3,2-trans-enoyl-CoA isomerase
LSRGLIRDGEKEILRKINKEECDVLMGRWMSDEFMKAIMGFFSRKSK